MTDIPLGPHTSSFKEALADFAHRYSVDTTCHLTFRGFYDRFKDGEHLSSIGKIARRKPNEVLTIYNKCFRDLCFGGLSYDDYRSFHAHRLFLETLPVDPILRFFAHETSLAGYNFQTVRQGTDHRGIFCTRVVLLNGNLCHIHCLRKGPSYIACRPLAEKVVMVGVVVIDPNPIQAIIIPSEILLARTRAREGTKVRVNPKVRYPRAVYLPEAA